MKNELIKTFVKKTSIKIIVFVFFMIVVSAIGQSMSPIISNELAMSQMQNSNEAFMIMNTYNTIRRQIINIAYTIIVVLFMGSVIRDTHKIAKSINAETDKEN